MTGPCHPKRTILRSALRCGTATICIAGLLGLGGCEPENPTGNGSGPRSGGGSPPGFIAVVGAARDDPLWPIIEHSARRHHDRAGLYETRYFVPEGNTPQDQLDLLETVCRPDLIGLCIHGLDPERLTPILERQARLGVRIVSILRPVPARLRVGHVGLDDDAIGRTLGEAVLDELPEGGSIMVIHAGSEHAVHERRWRTFRKTVAFRPRLEVFAELDCHDDPIQARRIIRERSARYPRLSAWVTLGDWSLGEAESVADLFGPEMNPEAKLLAFGGTPDHWPLMRQGRCRVIGVDYEELGSKALTFCELALTDREPTDPSQFRLPLRTIKSENLDDYVRDWQRWGGEQATPTSRSAADRVGR